MNFDLMAERTRYLKENEKGVEEMCQILEDMRNETILNERRKIAGSLLKIGKLSHQEIAECSQLSLEQIMVLSKEFGNK